MNEIKEKEAERASLPFKLDGYKYAKDKQSSAESDAAAAEAQSEAEARTLMKEKREIDSLPKQDPAREKMSKGLEKDEKNALKRVHAARSSPKLSRNTHRLVPVPVRSISAD